MKYSKKEKNMMQKEESCLRILLAKNAAGRIGFCENCDVAELEIGAISLRITAEDLHIVALLVKDADVRLAYYRLEKEYQSREKPLNDCNVH